jgi:glycerol-3-phosphate dehydrogenase
MAIFCALFSRRTLALTSGGTLLAAGSGYWYTNSSPTYPLSTKETRRPHPPWTPPSRKEMLQALKQSGVKVKTKNIQNDNSHNDDDDDDEAFDLMIVGGGATGADAASHGLKVALVERDDFSAGVYPFHFPFISSFIS